MSDEILRSALILNQGTFKDAEDLAWLEARLSELQPDQPQMCRFEEAAAKWGDRKWNVVLEV